MGDVHQAATVRRATRAAPERMWSVLADGWTYGSWVVGASRVRSVDASWPEVGSALHHSVGAWPLVRDDITSVIDVEPQRRILLAARIRPVGRQTVELTISSTAEGVLVSMREDAAEGPARLVPGAARQAVLAVRNREALQRLCLLAERATEPSRA